MPGPEDAMQVSALPESLVLDYLAEGAANVVYRLSFPEPPGQHGTGASTAAGSMTPGDGAEEDPHNGSIVDNQRSGASPAARGDWTRFQNRVLRLRKAVSAGVPIAISARSHGEVFQPLFPPGSLLDQDLVRMPSTIVSRCNARLREDERSGERPDKRHGVYLAEDEAYGILLTDMTPGTEGDGLRGACEQDAASALDADDPQRPRRRRCRTREVLVEFKSKWLVQSPSAPAGATRCRTCALRAQHNAVRRRQGQQPERSFCPLDLVSVDKARVDRAVRGVFDQNRRQQRQRQQRRQDVSPLFDELPDELPDNSLQERVVRFLHRHPLLLRLRQLQVELDQRGPAHAGLMPSSSSSSSSSSALAAASSGDFVGAVTGTETNALERDFLIAMTLRDCTVFLKVSCMALCLSVETCSCFLFWGCPRYCSSCPLSALYVCLYMMSLLTSNGSTDGEIHDICSPGERGRRDFVVDDVFLSHKPL